MNDLNGRELATVLAALRLWQETMNRDEDAELLDIATDGGTVEPLSDDEIEELCQRLNSPGKENGCNGT